MKFFSLLGFLALAGLNSLMISATPVSSNSSLSLPNSTSTITLSASDIGVSLSTEIPIPTSSALITDNSTVPLKEFEKRIDNARMTWYDIRTGVTACGKRYSPSDFVVALNGAQFGNGYPGPNCFKKIQIKYKGKTANAQIVDKCPGCPYGGLDLTEGLFKHFAPLSQGVLSATWNFV